MTEELKSLLAQVVITFGFFHLFGKRNINLLFILKVEAAGLKAEDVKRVEIVGGGSRIPCVQQTVKNFFGSVNKTLDNECTVAAGAALYASILDGSLPFTISGNSFGPDYKDVEELSEVRVFLLVQFCSAS